MTEKNKKVWKATLSGTYRNSVKEVLRFKDIVCYLPYIDRDIATASLISRITPMLLQQSEDINTSFKSVREVHVSLKKEEISEEDFVKKFSFYGKKIKDLDAIEAQYVATVFDFKSIPLFSYSNSLDETLKKLYCEFNNKFYKNKDFLTTSDVDFSDDDFELKTPNILGSRAESNFVSPDAFFKESGVAFEKQNELDKKSIEKKTEKKMPSFEELKEIAQNKGINFRQNIGYNALYEKIYE